MSKNTVDSIALLILAWFAGTLIFGLALDVIKSEFFSYGNQSKIKNAAYHILEFTSKFCLWASGTIFVSCILFGVVAATLNAFKTLS